jgi:hypothetical protein
MKSKCYHIINDDKGVVDMKKITKKQGAKFVEGAKRILSFIPNKQVDCYEGSSKYEVETQYGLLTITIPDEQSYCYTIFQRFDDVEKAKTRFACNPYSGKFNIHCNEADEALWNFYKGLVVALNLNNYDEVIKKIESLIRV